MKTVHSAIVLGIGFVLCAGSPAHAQLGELGNAVKEGAAGAAKQELMKQAGVPTAGTPAATPGAESGAANAPAGEPKAAAPGAAAPAAAPGTDTGAPDAPADE
jgi:hypothetical protein